MTDETTKCAVCGDPMPEGETMFKFHGYSGPCPKPPLDNFAKVRGVGRSADDQRTLLVALDRVPSDDDIRRIHDRLR